MNREEQQALVREVRSLRQRVSELERAQAEHKRAEEALRASEARALAFLESASEGVVITDRRGTIVLVNTRAEQMFGYERSELIGRELEVLLPERLRQSHLAQRAGFFLNPRMRAMGRGLDLAARRKDGTEFPVEISLSFAETEDGAHALAFVTDISQRLAVEQATRQAERLASLGTLAAGIAHEINNPITIISARIELMREEGRERGLPAEVLDDLSVLHRNALRVARIARSFLSFARQSPAPRGPVQLNRVIEETLLLVERQMGRDGIEIATRLDRDLPAVLGDSSALEQVLLNLLTNARDAMGGVGTITIETGPAPGRTGGVSLRVTDTGPGIPDETLPHIFDPFYTTKASGTGLGLSVSYGIIQDHNGTVDVQSNRGKGTSFVLTFPAFEHPAP